MSTIVVSQLLNGTYRGQGEKRDAIDGALGHKDVEAEVNIEHELEENSPYPEVPLDAERPLPGEAGSYSVYWPCTRFLKNKSPKPVGLLDP